MEENKDEAKRCLSIARGHASKNNLEAAIKFTEKSCRLYPTDDGNTYLIKLKTELKASHSSSHQSHPSKKPQQQQTYQSEKKRSKEEIQAVKAIRSCGSDYYKVLSLNRDCTDAQIKKAYRKLALQFHPDKNSAPGADEAFKLISKAFTILSDPQKRAIHDAGGGDPEQRGANHSSYTHTRYRGRSGMGEDMSAEDMFNMFFGNAFGDTDVRPRARQHPFFTQRQQRQQTNTDLSLWLQPMLILFLFAYAIISALFMGDSSPTFSFQRSPAYPEPRMTQHHHVQYYVNPTSFQPTVQNSQSLSRIERQIESNWVHNLQDMCQREQAERSRRLVQAGGGIFGFGRDENRYQAALKMPMKNCQELKRFGITSYHQF